MPSLEYLDGIPREQNHNYNLRKRNWNKFINIIVKWGSAFKPNHLINQFLCLKLSDRKCKNRCKTYLNSKKIKLNKWKWISPNYLKKKLWKLKYQLNKLIMRFGNCKDMEKMGKSLLFFRKLINHFLIHYYFKE